MTVWSSDAFSCLGPSVFALCRLIVHIVSVLVVSLLLAFILCLVLYAHCLFPHFLAPVLYMFVLAFIICDSVCVFISVYGRVQCASSLLLTAPSFCPCTCMCFSLLRGCRCFLLISCCMARFVETRLSFPTSATFIFLRFRCCVDGVAHPCVDSPCVFL